MRALLVVSWLAVVIGCGGGGGQSPDCEGLALADCRLADGCRADLCDACTCTPSYRGCVAAVAAPPACPELGCQSPVCCARQTDCPDITSCAPPGTAFGCGACNAQPGDCVDDAGCEPQGATMICEPIPCSCNGESACVPGCVAGGDTCAEGLACDVASARCLPQSCADDAGCPANFTCTAQSCARTECSDDLDCDGFCVEGACFSARGECRPPAA